MHNIIVQISEGDMKKLERKGKDADDVKKEIEATIKVLANFPDGLPRYRRMEDGR